MREITLPRRLICHSVCRHVRVRLSALETRNSIRRKYRPRSFLSYYSERPERRRSELHFPAAPVGLNAREMVAEPVLGSFFHSKRTCESHTYSGLKPSEFTNVFFQAIDPLRSARRLGPVLFQLPPALKCDEALLADFLATLPGEIRCAFEFRHTSWLQDSVYGLLEKHKVALCLAESEKLVIPEVITTDFVYSRLRMPEYSAEDRKESRAEWSSYWGEGRTSTCSSSMRTRRRAHYMPEELLKNVTGQAG